MEFSSEDKLHIRSQEQSFSTSRSFYFAGKNEGDGGTLKISIEAKGLTTPDMTRKLDELATATQKKAKEIVEGQKAPQQLFEPEESREKAMVDEWIKQYGRNCDDLRSAGGSLSKSEQ